MKTTKKKRNWNLILFLPGFIILIPILASLALLLRFSLSTGDSSLIQGLTLNQFVMFLKDPYYWGIFKSTVWISILVTVGAIAIGYPISLHIWRSTRKKMFLLIVLTPMITDIMVRTYGWLLILGPNGLLSGAFRLFGLNLPKILYTPTAIAIGLIHELIPLIVIPLLVSLRTIEPTQLKAGMTLGAGSWRLFTNVIFPLSVPGLMAGSILVFALTFSALVAPILLGGRQVMTLSLLIEQQMTYVVNWPFGAAISIILIVSVLLFSLGFERLIRKSFGKYVGGR